MTAVVNVHNKNSGWQFAPRQFEGLQLDIPPYLNSSGPVPVHTSISWPDVATATSTRTAGYGLSPHMDYAPSSDSSQIPPRKPATQDLSCAAEYRLSASMSGHSQIWMEKTHQHQTAVNKGEPSKLMLPPDPKRRRIRLSLSPSSHSSASSQGRISCRDKELPNCAIQPAWQKKAIFRSPPMRSSSSVLKSDSDARPPFKDSSWSKSPRRRSSGILCPGIDLPDPSGSPVLHSSPRSNHIHARQRHSDGAPSIRRPSSGHLSSPKGVFRWTRSVGAKFARRVTADSQRSPKRSSFASVVEPTVPLDLGLSRRKSVDFYFSESSNKSSFFSTSPDDRYSSLSLESLSSTTPISSMELGHWKEQIQLSGLMRHSETQAITGAANEVLFTPVATSTGRTQLSEIVDGDKNVDEKRVTSLNEVMEQSIDSPIPGRNISPKLTALQLNTSATLRRDSLVHRTRTSLGTQRSSLSNSPRPSGIVDVVYGHDFPRSRSPVFSSGSQQENERFPSLGESMGLRIPVPVLIQMAQSAHIALKSDLISKHPIPLFYIGVPYLSQRTYNWIRFVAAIILLSLIIEAVKVVVIMEKLTPALAFAAMPLAVISHLAAYMALRLASYWVLVGFTLSAAFIGIFDIVLTVTFATGVQEGESDGLTRGFYLSFSVVSVLVLVAAIAIVARACVLVRKDVSDLSIQLPIEWLEETLDPQPFLVWYFGLPSELAGWSGKFCT